MSGWQEFKMLKRVLVTGATGFVGRALCINLQMKGWVARAAVRDLDVGDLVSRERVVVGDIGPATTWEGALTDVDVIVHLAARVHVMRETEADPLTKYREVNVFGTDRLARMAADAGVKRLIYVSTIKVNGEETQEKPFAESDPPEPGDPYAVSKWEAEQALHRVAGITSLEVVVVRPPLIYGPGVKGNLMNLMRAVQNGWPLPLGSCDNRRSLIGLRNFVDFLTLCAEHPSAAAKTFLVSDGEDLSTPALIRRLAVAMGRPARLLSVPPSWLRTATRLLGRPGVYERLCGSLQVDSGLARRTLGWEPPETVNDGLARTVESFLQQHGGQVGPTGGMA